MLTIPLRNRDGETVAHALVDDEDAWATELRWYRESNGYVRRDTMARRCIRLHREVMGLVDGDGLAVDHRNGDKLDNRRSNLRILDQAGNCQNVRTTRALPRGVYFDKNSPAFFGQVKHNGERFHAGRFQTVEAANAAVIELRQRILPHSTG